MHPASKEQGSLAANRALPAGNTVQELSSQDQRLEEASAETNPATSRTAALLTAQRVHRSLAVWGTWQTAEVPWINLLHAICHRWTSNGPETEVITDEHELAPPPDPPLEETARTMMTCLHKERCTEKVPCKNKSLAKRGNGYEGQARTTTPHELE